MKSFINTFHWAIWHVLLINPQSDVFAQITHKSYFLNYSGWVYQTLNQKSTTPCSSPSSLSGQTWTHGWQTTNVEMPPISLFHSQLFAGIWFWGPTAWWRGRWRWSYKAGGSFCSGGRMAIMMAWLLVQNRITCVTICLQFGCVLAAPNLCPCDLCNELNWTIAMNWKAFRRFNWWRMWQHGYQLLLGIIQGFGWHFTWGIVSNGTCTWKQEV